MLNPHSLFAFGSLVMRSGITWIISPNPSLAFTCPIYCATNLNLTNPTPHQLPRWIYYMSAQSTKIRHAELHLSLWKVNIFRALLTLLTPIVTNVLSYCGQALMPWPLLFTSNTELLSKVKNLRRHRKYIRDPSNSATESQTCGVFLIAIFAWLVESWKMT